MSKSLILTFFTVLAIGNHPSDGGAVSEFQPEFAEPLENVTVPVGRDATFTCVVRGLGGYRIGWVKADSKAIQAIHTHVITHNPRVTVSHADHSMWHLHIKAVKEEDRGSYMCQINTDPMISQISYLEVVIPPDFIPEETSGDLMAPEGSTVKLNCNAKGHPTPKIQWKRENDLNITLKSPSGAKTQVSSYEGNILRLLKVSRADMGAYLCIASNQVPPTISKRIMVSVHFHPSIQVQNQLIGALVDTDVTLECNVEAFPRSIHFWTKDKGTSMIISTDRYEVKEIIKSMFEVKMMLIIRKFQKSDSGSYECIAKNSLGDVQSIVKLHDLTVNGEGGGGGGGDKDKLNKSPGNAFVYDNEDSDEYGEESLIVTRIPDSSMNNYYGRNTKGGSRGITNTNSNNNNNDRLKGGGGGVGGGGGGGGDSHHPDSSGGSRGVARHNKNTHHAHNINNNKHSGSSNSNSNPFQTVIVPINRNDRDPNSDGSNSANTPNNPPLYYHCLIIQSTFCCFILYNFYHHFTNFLI